MKQMEIPLTFISSFQSQFSIAGTWLGINFINFGYCRPLIGQKEVGVRKSMGFLHGKKKAKSSRNFCGALF